MSLGKTGFDLLQNFIDSDAAAAIIEGVDQSLLCAQGGGIRNADKKFNVVATLASSDYLLAQASRYLSGSPFLVRAILFDKSFNNNWLVTWHQDKTVAVSSKFEKEGWGPWSFKDGVHHVQPPLEVLESMITFRIHLDDSTCKNGCLKVMPNSHRLGLLSQEDIYRHTASTKGEVIEAPALSALVMRPHILHASSKAEEPSRRRVLHLEYSSYLLPEGINWA